MIARVTVLLPFSFSIPEGQRISPIEMVVEGYSVRIHPPCQGTFEQPMHPLMPNVYDRFSLERRLAPAAHPIPYKALTINDRTTFVADLALIEFFAPEFERRNETGDGNAEEPLVKIAFDLINQMLERVRLITRNSCAKPIQKEYQSWCLNYYNDDGSQLPLQSGLTNHKIDLRSTVRFSILSNDIWSLAWQDRDTPELRSWDKLLLDAVDLLPEAGAAIAVANAGIEAFAIWMNQVLADSSTMDKEFWNWLEDRSNLQRNPSVKDRFDIILKTFTGHSMKENKDLWRVLTNLRNARNNFMHEGVVRIARNGKELTGSEVDSLIRRSSDIVTWVESFLPEDKRRYMRKDRIQLDLQYVKEPS